jgi:hypothetical protein
MSEHSKTSDATRAATPADRTTSVKAPWHAPTLEEVDYSATEAAGSGSTYDFLVYTGSV